jgi:hypothetical protein
MLMGAAMNLWSTLGVAMAAAALGAAEPAATLSQAQPGQWEIIGAPGVKTPIRQCFSDILALARFEHRTKNCSSRVTSQHGNSTVVNYRCGNADFGQSQIDVLTPRSLRISTQGISDSLPFNYVLQAHRVGDCTASAARH